MATNETVTLDAPHPPHPAAIQAFSNLSSEIKHAILQSRRDWDKHETRMWARASHLNDKELVNFDIASDLVEVRSGTTSYGQVIFGRIRIPGINDELGEGFVHVRIHDSPGEGTNNVRFHSLFTDERIWRAVQKKNDPLEFFNE